jgi:RNA polymerase sigma-70 factor (ECF subfamily)
VVVCAAGGDAPARVALAELCQAYWYPLYAFLRHSGIACQDAEDTVQEFFTKLVEQNIVGYADPTRGRFRTFLIASLKQFLARRRAYEHAAKRRPEQPVISLDASEGERRFLFEFSHDCTAEKLYEHSWALAVIDAAMRRLQAEWERAGRGHRFEVLKDHLIEVDLLSGRELAATLGMSEGAARVATHRLRRRFGEILREEVAQTLESGEDIDDELAQLSAALDI